MSDQRFFSFTTPAHVTSSNTRPARHLHGLQAARSAQLKVPAWFKRGMNKAPSAPYREGTGKIQRNLLLRMHPVYALLQKECRWMHDSTDGVFHRDLPLPMRLIGRNSQNPTIRLHRSHAHAITPADELSTVTGPTQDEEAAAAHGGNVCRGGLGGHSEMPTGTRGPIPAATP